MVPTTGWAVVVTQTQDEAYSSVSASTKMKMLAIAGTILAITIIIGVIISRRMVKTVS